MFIIKYLKSLALIFLSILLFSVLVGTFNYFNILGNSPIKVISIIMVAISLLIGGFYLGKNSSQKGFIEGIKMGLIVIFILFMFGYLAFDIDFSLSLLLFYSIILISSILGSILGINKRSSN